MPRFRSYRFAAFLLILLVSTPVWADLVLPALIGDHMVLQQGKKAVIWGKDKPGQSVTVNLAGASGTVKTGPKGNWKIELPPLSAGGPFELVVSGSRSVTVRDVLVGEVWIGSGQSNMELPMAVSRDAAKDIPAANQPGIRLFKLERASSFTPLEDVQGSWQVCSPDTVKDFSAVAYYFGKGLHEKLKTPVGLIESAWGGSAAEAWTPRWALEKEPSFASLLKDWDHNQDQVRTWSKGLPFDLWVSDILLIPKDPGAKPVTVQVRRGVDAAGWGGTWNHSEKPGSTGKFEAEGREGHYSGTVQGGGWGSVSTAFTPGNQPVDLSPYQAIQVRVKGHGKFLVSVSQPSIVDYDFYATAPFEPANDWKLLTFPLQDLKQGGWGVAKPFTPNSILSLSFAVQSPFWPDLPAVIYNAMIAPLTNYSIRGVAWYQGESNTGRAAGYRVLLSTLIQSWRQAWGDGFTFLVVQLPNFMAIRPEPSESGWAEVREAQLKALDLPDTAVVPTIDLGDPDNIHPKDKSDVGNRLVRAALGLSYQKRIDYLAPVFDSAVEKAGKVIVNFKAGTKGVVVKGKGPLNGFSLAGSGGVFHWAHARIMRKAVVVWSESVPMPVEVRYAWADNPVCNLWGKNGLPVFPFKGKAVSLDSLVR